MCRSHIFALDLFFVYFDLFWCGDVGLTPLLIYIISPVTWMPVLERGDDLGAHIFCLLNA